MNEMIMQTPNTYYSTFNLEMLISLNYRYLLKSIKHHQSSIIMFHVPKSPLFLCTTHRTGFFVYSVYSMDLKWFTPNVKCRFKAKKKVYFTKCNFWKFMETMPLQVFFSFSRMKKKTKTICDYLWLWSS